MRSEPTLTVEVITDSHGPLFFPRLPTFDALWLLRRMAELHGEARVFVLPCQSRALVEAEDRLFSESGKG